MSETGTVVVLKWGSEEERLSDALAYTVEADGSLQIERADGSKVEFTFEEWIDVRFEGKGNPRS